MREPARGVAKLDGTNSAQQAWWKENAGELQTNFLEQMKQIGEGSGSVQELMDSHLERVDQLKMKMPAADDFRLPHIKRLAKTPKPNPVHEALVGLAPSQIPKPEEPDFVAESLLQRKGRGKFLSYRARAETPRPDPLREVLRRAAQQDDYENRLSSSSDEEEEPTRRRGGRRSAGRHAEESHEEEAPSVPWEPMEPLRHTSLGTFWSQYGASWSEFNRCVVPSTFPSEETEAGPTLDSYFHTRNAASLFDVSYKVGVKVVGADREFVADQFLTCSLRCSMTPSCSSPLTLLRSSCLATTLNRSQTIWHNMLST